MSAWLDAALTEYKALREEVLQHLLLADRTVQLGLTALAATVAFGIANESASTAAFVLLIPTFGAYVAITWSRITVHIADLGDYLHDLEGRINNMCDDQTLGGPMRWETARPGRQQGQATQPRGMILHATFAALLAIPLMSSAYGDIELFRHKTLELAIGGMIFDLFLLAVALGAYAAGFNAARSTLFR